MEFPEAFGALEDYNLWLIIIGLAVLATSALPRLLASKPLSMPIALLVLGYAVVALPLGLEAPDPRVHGDVAEHLTELGVIIALVGAGLKIDRKFGWKRWAVTWRLLGITMIITIGLAVVIGWWIAALVPATALLFGAVISPTDPVLAADVQVGAPQNAVQIRKERADQDTDQTHHGVEEDDHDDEDEVRFALTSEAGFNDGLAFPFTNMAIAMVVAGAHPSNWIGTWLVVDVLYKLGVAAILGLGLGYLLAKILFSMPAENDLAKAMVGLGALAATLLLFGVTEYLGGYGFLATFIGAVVIRNTDHKHEFHTSLHTLTEKIERLLMALILIGLGGALAGGLLDALDWRLVVSAVLIVFVVRPLAGVLGLIGHDRAPWRERLAISFLGIRGIGSLYYLAYALNKETFSGVDEIWALVGLTLVISVFVHGLSASAITDRIDKMRRQDVNAASPKKKPRRVFGVAFSSTEH
jgi:NhaP-type Na+/H+ or K+/H+ antiporter